MVDSAKKLTGPKTAAGKRRASRNSFKHGLSAPAFHTDRAERIRTLAKTLSKGPPTTNMWAIALRAAQARVLLEEISTARRQILEKAMEELRLEARNLLTDEEVAGLALAKTSGVLVRLLRYERRALGKWRKAKTSLQS
jgi:hypothetical protein